MTKIWKKIIACKDHNCFRCQRKTGDIFYADGFNIMCEDCHKELKNEV